MVKMTAFFSVIATLCLTVVTTANENPPGRCCPNKFEVDPDPADYHFRCEVADLTQGCDAITMTESVPNTLINTQAGGTACNNFNSYLMTDPNWQDIQPFQPNVACANYLPPVPGCCWQLYLVKKLDPIVCGDSCQCDCEDHVHFEEMGAFPDNAKYCDFAPDPPATPPVGWCGSNTGPHNVLGTLPFRAGVNTGVLTTFRSDNTNGAGEGALVFATAAPCSKKRSIPLRQPYARWPAGVKKSNYCQKMYRECNDQKCKFPCECYQDKQQFVSCSLHDLFTDNTGNTTRKYHNSPYAVVRRAAWLAVYNIYTFGRPVPTFTQLQKQTSLSTSYNTSCKEPYRRPT